MTRSLAACRDDVTRTRDPYVPNVVRYQLRYISIFKEKAAVGKTAAFQL